VGHFGPRRPAQEAPHRQIRIRVLHAVCIIDDDESVRTATTCFVRSLGHVARTFASAEEFLSSPYVDEAVCLIVDVNMPRMGGLELQSRLRDKGLSTPIILITAYPEERARARALGAGAIGYLDKPFDSEALIRCLDIALHREGGHVVE
jgi:FixJ family two-component response regulator